MRACTDGRGGGSGRQGRGVMESLAGCGLPMPGGVAPAAGAAGAGRTTASSTAGRLGTAVQQQAVDNGCAKATGNPRQLILNGKSEEVRAAAMQVCGGCRFV